MPREPNRCACGGALESPPGRAYNEEAFRYFLAVERKRSKRSARPFLLLLLGLEEPSGMAMDLDPVTTAKLFSGLSQCLRETDFLGWYREGRVVGAVLTLFEESPGADMAQMVVQKVRRTLHAGLPPRALHRLHVRVYRRPPNRNAGARHGHTN
jgi:hypothetical protein